MKDITVVIPVYTHLLTDHEKSSLKNAMFVLKRIPIVIVKPLSLSGILLEDLAPGIPSISFPDIFFDSIEGYNRLMLSTQFYEAFSDSRYILIHQLDAWVFSDNLEEWCSMEFDYIGAPWIKRGIYQKPLVKQYMSLLRFFTKLTKTPDRQSLYNQVGNGGLSIRKVSSHLKATIELKNIIEIFLAGKRDHMHNEDVFWSVEVNRHLTSKFTYPHYSQAIKFSFDKHPEYCYKINGGELPLGCHGWSKKRMYPFWKNIIKLSERPSP